MAFDAYLKIPKAEGSSTDTNHQNWIDVSDFTYGTTQNVTKGRGVHASGRGDLKEFSFTYVADKSVPKTMHLCAAGTTIPEIDFDVRMNINGQSQSVMGLKLSQAVIVKCDIETSGEADAITTGGAAKSSDVFCKIDIAASKVEWSATQFKVDGSKGGTVQASFDQSTNVIA